MHIEPHIYIIKNIVNEEAQFLTTTKIVFKSLKKVESEG